MSLEQRVDELARALARPMPRRSMLRLLGATFGAAAVPAFARRAAFAAGRSASATCGPDARICEYVDPANPRGPQKEYCCGPPAWLWACGPVSGPGAGTCQQTCIGKDTYTCTSGVKDAGGFTKGDCCAYPTTKGCNSDGTCRPNCALIRAVQCEDTCCGPNQLCKAGKCFQPPCPPSQSPCGPGNCCPPGSRCVNAKRKICSPCKKGEEQCGSKCCAKGTYCCGSKCCTHRNGSCCGDSPICCEGTDCCKIGNTAKCCPKGETCATSGSTGGLVVGRAPNVCCPPERTVSLTSGVVCCPPGYVSMGGKLVVPVGGGGGLCCKASLACGSGSDLTCCSDSEMLGIHQVCRNGKCVSA